MNIAFPHLPEAILIAVPAAYAFAPWRYLKGEQAALYLVRLAGVSVALRLDAPDNAHPPGLDIDEIKNLGSTVPCASRSASSASHCVAKRQR